MTDTPPDVAMARRAAASIRPHSHNSALILDGERDGTDVVQAALAAIRETTEANAKIADDRHAPWVAKRIRASLKGQPDV